ncbi:hypothetical protein V8F33_009658 [Rhypophila sp. PSN 637]
MMSMLTTYHLFRPMKAGKEGNIAKYVSQIVNENKPQQVSGSILNLLRSRMGFPQCVDDAIVVVGVSLDLLSLLLLRSRVSLPKCVNDVVIIVLVGLDLSIAFLLGARMSFPQGVNDGVIVILVSLYVSSHFGIDLVAAMVSRRGKTCNNSGGVQSQKGAD